MNLHETKDFKDAVLATAQHMGIPDVFVEKDYWVTLVLYRLSLHPASEKIVFKGGTSLSKAYGMIERFSEDVDLAVAEVSSLSGNQIKNLIDKTSKELMANPFSEIKDDKRNSKGSRFRRAAYRYPRLQLDGDFMAASPDLLLEINSFADPTPITRKNVRSYIGDFFLKHSPQDLATHGLESFGIQVLGLERTYVEKIMGLIRHSYLGAQSVREKIRHLYDLARLDSYKEIQEFKSNKTKFKKVVASVKKSDQASTEFSGEWLQNPFPEAPLFTDQAIKSSMKESYQSSSLQSLIWDQKKTPSFDTAWNALMEISKLF